MNVLLEKVLHLTTLDEPFKFYDSKHDEHYHEELEIARIMGDGKITINHVEYQVEVNDLILINPLIVHSFNCEYKSLLVNMEAIGLNTMDIVTKKYIYPIYSRTIVFPAIIKNYEILNIVTQLFLTLENTEELYEFEMKELIFLLFHDLFRLNLLTAPTSINILSLEKISTALAYIEEHYQEDINIDILAKVCGLSSSHFMKTFKQKTNQSCNEYLIEYRLKKAQELLELSDHPIRSIVYEVGFRNVSNFNRLFKKHYGLTPEQYRKSKRK